MRLSLKIRKTWVQLKKKTLVALPYWGRARIFRLLSHGASVKLSLKLWYELCDNRSSRCTDHQLCKLHCRRSCRWGPASAELGQVSSLQWGMNRICFVPHLSLWHFLLPIILYSLPYNYLLSQHFLLFHGLFDLFSFLLLEYYLGQILTEKLATIEGIQKSGGRMFLLPQRKMILVAAVRTQIRRRKEKPNCSSSSFH